MITSRREFLKSSGALFVSFSAASLTARFADAQGPFDTHPSHIDPAKLDSWLAIGSDGAITAYTGKCDFGQGMFTVQTQLVAEELCVSMDRVKLIQCDTSVSPDQGTTSGSQSTPTNFNSGNLAQAAATAREALKKMAAERWSEPVDQLNVVDGVVTGTSGRRITYAELIGSKHFDIPMSATAKRRSPEEWKVLGKSIPSMDRVALMTGQFEYVHNVRVPGMLHGRVVRPPEVGARLVSMDENSVRHIPGLVKVVTRENFLGVVAEKQWQAIEAVRQLAAKWTAGSGLPPQATFYESLRRLPSRDSLIVDSKDVEAKLSSASTVVKATYSYPYQMHGSVGTSCSVADVRPGHATVWSATQSVYSTRSIVAKLLGLPPDSVRVIYVRGSGCYGLNGADTVSLDAALLSHAVGRPVRVQLSRQDEMAWENFGAACVIDQSAALDSSGSIVAWECENWVASLGDRPGYDKPGNVITGLLAGFSPEHVTARAAAELKGKLKNRSNHAPSYIAGCIDGECGGGGTVGSERVLSHTVPSQFFTGPLRSPLRIQNTFAHECFMDELCARTKTDPVAFRLRHLSDQRIIGVVKAAAQAAKWEKRPSPQQNPSRSGTVSGRGIACVAYEGDNGYAALVAEVSVDVKSGRVQPTKFIVAIDCGIISNPDGVRNQTEGGLLQGMSRALFEEVSWDDKRVTSVDWESYKSAYLDFKIPSIDVVLMNPKEVSATGAGETAITVVPAAIGNAIFDATGVRVREVPFTPDRVKAALVAANLAGNVPGYEEKGSDLQAGMPKLSTTVSSTMAALFLLFRLISFLSFLPTNAVAATSKSGDPKHANATSAPDAAAAASAFEAMATVLHHPRCMNCHSKGDFPRQGDDSHKHTLNVPRGVAGDGISALKCSTCHQDHNLEGMHTPPGAPDWHLPPPAMPMIWEGLTNQQLCELFKDPKQNGRRNVDEIVEHMSTPLVRWGWHPGHGRTPIPVPENDFMANVKKWAANGAACPSSASPAAKVAAGPHQ